MLPHTNPDGTLTEWGAQQQIGLFVETPDGVVRAVLSVSRAGMCEVGVNYVPRAYFHCSQLRPHPVPLTPETAYVGQWARVIETQELVKINRLGNDTIECEYEYLYTYASLEALPSHCQAVKPNQDA